MGRPKKYNKTKATAEKVRKMAGLKLSNNQIAAAIGMHPKSLARYYEKELDAGRALGQMAAAEVMMNLIAEDNFNAAKFYLESSPEWNKKNITEVSGPEGGAIEVDNKNSAVEDLARLLGVSLKED